MEAPQHSVQSPQSYGNRHLPRLIEKIAQATPEKPFVSLAKTADPRDGFEDISYGAFSQAVDRCAFWLDDNIGHHEDTKSLRPIFSTIARQDMRGGIMVLAGAKTGHQVSYSLP